jgi:hypothetical protein
MWVAVAAAVEVMTGVGLIIRPTLLVWLLFGTELSGGGQALGRLTGFALLALVLACWSGIGAEARSALRALLLFSLLTTIYLRLSGGGRELVVILLWPAAAGHAVLTILLARSWLSGPR